MYNHTARAARLFAGRHAAFAPAVGMDGIGEGNRAGREKKCGKNDCLAKSFFGDKTKKERKLRKHGVFLCKITIETENVHNRETPVDRLLVEHGRYCIDKMGTNLLKL